MKKANGGRAGAGAEVADRASRPIIFDAESIRAMRNGRKEQSRRVVDFGPDPTPYIALTHAEQVNGLWSFYSCDPARFPREIRDRPGRKCPYGKPGDLLWVRETWACCELHTEPDGERLSLATSKFCRAQVELGERHVVYRADGEDAFGGCWRSPIHMPRWASRLTLRLTDVRVQRVQEISEADAKAEGVFWDDLPPGQQKKVERKRFVQQYKGRPDLVNDMDFARVAAFEVRWDAINAKRGYPWASNPCVWALTFEPIWQNIDAVLKAEPESAVLP